MYKIWPPHSLKIDSQNLVRFACQELLVWIFECLYFAPLFFKGRGSLKGGVDVVREEGDLL